MKRRLVVGLGAAAVMVSATLPAMAANGHGHGKNKGTVSESTLPVCSLNGGQLKQWIKDHPRIAAYFASHEGSQDKFEAWLAANC